MTSLGEPSRQAVARAYRDAAEVLDSGNFEKYDEEGGWRG